jgi:hypothetical protein
MTGRDGPEQMLALVEDRAGDDEVADMRPAENTSCSAS